MESSAPKRRKTSPTSSVPVESTKPPGPPSQQEQEQGPSSRARSPQRPSFAAPTKSSLARSNPDHLARRQTASSQRAEEPPASLPNSNDDDAEVSTALTAQLQHESEGDGDTSPHASPDAAAATRQAHSAPAATTQGHSEPQSPLKRAGGSTLGGQPPRRTPNRPRPEPRPLPPPGPETEEDLLNPLAGRALPRSPLRNTGLLLAAAAHEEPELPPTPQHPDPVVSTPPSGIHNTPSKKRRQGIARGADARQTSPSKGASQQEKQQKQPEKQPERALGHGLGKGPPPQKESDKQMTLRIARRGSPVEIVEADLPPPQKEKEIQGKPRDGFAPGTHPRRSIRLNPHVEKENERDALLREVAQLEADLDLARRSNESAAKGSPSSADKKDVLDLLRRHLLPTGRTEPKAESQTAWLEAAMNPIAMLGFNGVSSLLLPPPLPQEEKEKAEPRPVSHHPIPMTASEELPYLQVFTPLAFTSTITAIAPSPDHEGGPTLQKHTIHVRSASPPGLFVARLEMTVNTRTLAVSSLTVPRLDPAAAGELTPFVDSVCSPKAPHHSALTRNVSVLAWAMAEWYRVALKRAKFWHALERQLGPGNKDGPGEAVRAMRTRKRKRRRGQQQVEDGGGAGESFGSAESGGLDGTLLSKADLLPHMGRTSMDLEVPCFAEKSNGVKSDLRVSWGIEFDWTGEARSNLGVGIGVSGKCELSYHPFFPVCLRTCWASCTNMERIKGQAADDRKSFVGLPKLFDKLVQGGEDPLTAVKTVFALLAGEPTA